VLITLAITEQDCSKELFDAVKTTHCIFEFIWPAKSRLLNQPPPWSATLSWWWGFVHRWPKKFLQSGG